MVSQAVEAGRNVAADPDNSAARVLGDRRKAAKFYLSVQGFRGFAALSVLCLHLELMALHGGFLPPLPRLIRASWDTLGGGVGLFFMISGFVIPASLVRHGDVKKFMIDRLLRIMPLFVALHLVVYSAGPVLGYKWMAGLDLSQYVWSFLTNLFFLAYPLGLPLAQQNAWTLTYEWAFYLFVAGAWIWTCQAQNRTRNAIVVGLAVVLCLLFPVCIFFVIGMTFARYLPGWRMARPIEIFAAPLVLFSYYAFPFHLAIFSGAVLMWLVLQDGSLTAWLLETPVFRFLGMISYSLYLVHPFAVFPFQVLGSRLAAHGHHGWAIFIIYLILAPATAIGAATVTYHLLEVRLRAILAAWLKRQKPVAKLAA